MTDDADSWLSSRKLTNQLLGVVIVVLAAGFISIGGERYAGLRIVAELLLGFVLLGALVLFLGWLMRADESADEEA